jgi:hypothetical protein
MVFTIADTNRAWASLAGSPSGFYHNGPRTIDDSNTATFTPIPVMFSRLVVVENHANALLEFVAARLARECGCIRGYLGGLLERCIGGM